MLPGRTNYVGNVNLPKKFKKQLLVKEQMYLIHKSESGRVWKPFIVWGWMIHQNNRLGTRMKKSWEAQHSDAPRASSARKSLRLFCEKSAINPRVYIKLSFSTKVDLCFDCD